MATEEYKRQVVREVILRSLNVRPLTKEQADEAFQKLITRVQVFRKEWSVNRVVVFGSYARGTETFDLWVGVDANIAPEKRAKDAISRGFGDIPNVFAFSLNYPPEVDTLEGLMKLTEVPGFYDEPVITVWEKRKPTTRR